MISKACRSQIVAQLNDPTTGLNANLETICAADGITPLSFNLENTDKRGIGSAPSLIFAYVDLDQIQNSLYTLPCIVMYAMGAEQFQGTNRVKSSVFHGLVRMALDCHISAALEPGDTATLEDQTDALEEALTNTFNVSGLNWNSDPVVWYALANFSRSPLQAIDNYLWRRMLRCEMTLEVRT